MIASEHIVVADSSGLTQYESHSDSLVQHFKAFSFQVFFTCVHAAVLCHWLDKVTRVTTRVFFRCVDTKVQCHSIKIFSIVSYNTAQCIVV